MNKQNYEKVRDELVKKFKSKFGVKSKGKIEKLKLSWSNWGFGTEPLEKTARRLEKNKIEWIELHGNRYGKDLGYRSVEVLKLLGDHGIKVAGICGMFGPENDLSSNSGTVRQRAIDYIRRQIELCVETKGTYLLVVPGAVGRPTSYDDNEFERSAETLRIVAGDFEKSGIRAAIEPIRSAEVSLVHTVENAEKYIAAVSHPAIAHINGDIYHMQSEESNISLAILKAGKKLINLHLADSNRCALGQGSMDVDSIIMALYCIGFSGEMRFATPEPLGPAGNPYPAMFGKPDEKLLDSLVAETAKYWREREEIVINKDILCNEVERRI
jgi:sugar phosphate isomerase/epimerase